MKKKRTKEEAKEKLEEEERKRREAIENDEKAETAFLEEEQNILRREKNDQINTKRIIDKMMLTKSDDGFCELLSNYKGIFFPNINITIYNMKYVPLRILRDFGSQQ